MCWMALLLIRTDTQHTSDKYKVHIDIRVVILPNL